MEMKKERKMLPLAGITVVEFCQIAAGPFAGMLLADMGAEVIKVESPDGDGMRSWPPLSGGFSENFASLNRNKRSIVLDLKNERDLERARQLCLQSDVVLENFRPSVLPRLGLGYEELSKKSPRLIYCSISAYGQQGPRSREGGFDVTLQAVAGVMSVTGGAGGEPVKCGVPVADFAAGLYAAYSIASMVRRVEREGVGGHIDIPMLGATLGIAALQVSEYFGSGKDPGKLGSAHPRNAPYQAFRCGDGYFVLAAGNNDLFRRTCEVVELPELVSDPRFESPLLRANHQDELRDILEKEFVKFSAEAWLARMRDRGVPCAPINTYSQALADEQVDHYGWVQPMTLPGGHQTKTFKSPIQISGIEFDIYRQPPALGEHTQEITAELAASKA
jgi:crotonobetainyl-CoA:carnitine CoA-transferase CaiB-like acyl-CoA transferase